MRRRNFLSGLLALPFLGFLKPRAEAKENFDRTWECAKAVSISHMPNWAPPGPWQVNPSPVFPVDVLEKYAKADVKEHQLVHQIIELKKYKMPVDYGRRLNDLMFIHPGLTLQEIADRTGQQVHWLEAVHQYHKLSRQATKLWRDGKIDVGNLYLLCQIPKIHQYTFLEEAEKLSYNGFVGHIQHYLELQRCQGVRAIINFDRTSICTRRDYRTTAGDLVTYLINPLERKEDTCIVVNS